MTADSALMLAVAAFSCVTLCAAVPFVVWAARNGQFKDQDRARFLALGRPPRQHPGGPDS